MGENKAKEPADRAVKFVPATGSVVGGMAKDKAARLTDAMADIQLAMDGLRSRGPGEGDGGQWTMALGALARTCSVFLRKTVLGDRDRRETRLLDDHVLDTTAFRFDRVRRIPRDRRRRIATGVERGRRVLEATRLDDETLEPEETYRFTAGPQALELSIEWPLPGAADWTGETNEDSPWLVDAGQLFEAGEPGLTCDEWLGQQVVMFDGKGVSLKELIRTVVNYEGAHSIDVGRLLTVEGEKPSKAAENPVPHILNAVTVFGVRYAHLVVIECAMYLYTRLVKEDWVERPTAEIYIAKPGFRCSKEQAEAARPKWLRFCGGMTISFFNAPTVIRYEIKPVG